MRYKNKEEAEFERKFSKQREIKKHEIANHKEE